MKVHIKIQNVLYTRCGTRINKNITTVNEEYEALRSTCKKCQKASLRYKSLNATRKHFAEIGEEWPRKDSPIKV